MQLNMAEISQNIMPDILIDKDQRLMMQEIKKILAGKDIGAKVEGNVLSVHIPLDGEYGFVLTPSNGSGKHYNVKAAHFVNGGMNLLPGGTVTDELAFLGKYGDYFNN